MLGDKAIQTLKDKVYPSYCDVIEIEELQQVAKERDELKRRVEKLEEQHRVDTLAIEIATKFINDDIENEKYIELGKALKYVYTNKSERFLEYDTQDDVFWMNIYTSGPIELIEFYRKEANNESD